MTADDLILRLVREDRIRADPQTGRVWGRNQHGRWIEKAVCRKRGGRARFHFEVYGRKTVVNRARVLRLVLDGRAPAAVDHRDGDRTNDAVTNLGDHTRAESDRQGRAAQARAVAGNAAAYFDWIAAFGTEPPDHLDVLPL